MPVFKKSYPIIAEEDAVDDLRRAIEAHKTREDIALLDYSVNFSGIHETEAQVTVVMWTSGDESTLGVLPWDADQSGAETVSWTEIIQACGGGDPT